MDRTIDEEVNVGDVSENSVMNDVTMGDIVRESSPVKLLSEPHGDASSDDCTQEIDNDRISRKNHTEPYMTTIQILFVKITMYLKARIVP